MNSRPIPPMLAEAIRLQQENPSLTDGHALAAAWLRRPHLEMGPTWHRTN